MKKILILILLFVSLSCNNEIKEEETFSQRFHLPTVTVIINGQKIDMIMDTGGAMTILDEKVAKKLGISFSPSETRFITGYGGRRAVNETEISSISIGKIEMNADIYVSDLSNIIRELPIGGILGIEHMTSAGLVINLKKNTIISE